MYGYQGMQMPKFDEHHKRYRCCCKCCHIKYACIFACLVELVFAIYSIINYGWMLSYNIGIGTTVWIAVVHIIIPALVIIAVICVFVGIAKTIPEMVIMNIIMLIVWMVVLVVQAILQILILTRVTDFMRDAMMREFESRDLTGNAAQNPNLAADRAVGYYGRAAIIGFICTCIIEIILCAWFIHMFRRLRRYLTEKRQFLEATKHQRNAMHM